MKIKITILVAFVVGALVAAWAFGWAHIDKKRKEKLSYEKNKNNYYSAVDDEFNKRFGDRNFG